MIASQGPIGSDAVASRSMVVGEMSDARKRLQDLRERIRPDAARRHVIEELDDLFRSGVVPDPAPDGFLRGTLVTMSVTQPTDGLVRRIADVWMPWRGKSFDYAARIGINVLTPAARQPMKLLWPSYEPERELADRVEAFPFRNAVGRGAVDHDIDVYKIDYDFDSNPRFIIRRILDELVQIDEGLYLGKILFRRGPRFVPIGYFTLER